LLRMHTEWLEDYASIIKDVPEKQWVYAKIIAELNKRRVTVE